MGRLPIISGVEARKAFEKAGWVFDRQSGSHMVLLKADSIYHLSIQRHNALHRGTLRSLIADAGMTVDEFIALL